MSLSKKIVAFDLDGTLTESKQALTSEVASALVALAQQKKVAIISGGSFGQYKKQFLPYFIEFAGQNTESFKNLVLMPTSGTEVYQYSETEKTWVLTDREVFPEKTKQKVLEVLHQIVSSGEYGIAKESYGEIIEDRGNQITLSALGQEAPIEKKKDWDPDQKKRQIIKAKIEAQIPDVSIGIGGMTSVDVLPNGFNKSVSLKQFIKKLGLENTDLLYVGDALFPGGNDYSVVEGGLEAVQVSGPKDTISKINEWIS